jgi:hypothetical protein
MNGFTDKEIIGGLLSLLVLSYAAIFAFIFRNLRELRRELHDDTSAVRDETSALRRNMQLEFTRVHEQLTGLAVSIARLESSLWGRTPSEPRKAEG